MKLFAINMIILAFILSIFAIITLIRRLDFRISHLEKKVELQQINLKAN